MRNLLNILLVLALAVWIGAFFPGCGHGGDANPYEQVMTGRVDPDGFEIASQGRYAKYAVEGMAKDLFVTSSEIIKTMGFFTTIPSPKISKALKPGELSTREISISKENEAGDTVVTAVGTAVSVQTWMRSCAIFSTFDIEYNSYIVNPYVTLNGSGRAKVILMSLGCRYYGDINAEVVVNGNFRVTTNEPDTNDQTFEELLFKVDYDSDRDIATDIDIQSAELNTDDGILYCFDYSGSTQCLNYDLSEPLEANTCSASDFEHRECDPSEEPFYIVTHLYEGGEIFYELPLMCNDDGLWSPPCSTSDTLDICPHGTSCVAADDIDWGNGLEDYGYCSCTSQ